MSVVPFPTRTSGTAGTIHIMGDAGSGYEVGHESSSGNSWGSFSGPYATAQEAVAAAFALNRNSYGGQCDIALPAGPEGGAA